MKKGTKEMVNYNHYLKELGIKETDYPFNKEDVVEPSRYLPDEEGFVPAEFFSLDYSMALYIYSHLCYFRDNCLVGYPAGMTFEKWENILDTMIEAFKLIIVKDDKETKLYDEAFKEYSKRKQRKIRQGLRYFGKYFYCLWY